MLLVSFVQFGFKLLSSFNYLIFQPIYIVEKFFFKTNFGVYFV